MSEKKSLFYSQVKQLGAVTAIPALLVLGPLVGYWAGSWLDKKFQLFPWFTIFFLVSGFSASGREIYLLLKQILREDKKG